MDPRFCTFWHAVQLLSEKTFTFSLVYSRLHTLCTKLGLCHTAVPIGKFKFRQYSFIAVFCPFANLMLTKFPCYTVVLRPTFFYINFIVYVTTKSDPPKIVLWGKKPKNYDALVLLAVGKSKYQYSAQIIQ